jgi:hypothetical protein
LIRFCCFRPSLLFVTCGMCFSFIGKCFQNNPASTIPSTQITRTHTHTHTYTHIHVSSRTKMKVLRYQPQFTLQLSAQEQLLCRHPCYLSSLLSAAVVSRLHPHRSAAHLLSEESMVSKGLSTPVIRSEMLSIRDQDLSMFLHTPPLTVSSEPVAHPNSFLLQVREGCYCQHLVCVCVCVCVCVHVCVCVCVCVCGLLTHVCSLWFYLWCWWAFVGSIIIHNLPHTHSHTHSHTPPLSMWLSIVKTGIVTKQQYMSHRMEEMVCIEHECAQFLAPKHPSVLVLPDAEPWISLIKPHTTAVPALRPIARSICSLEIRYVSV